MNNSASLRKDNVVFATALVFATFVGFLLRWYLLGDQVLLDDEWHGLFYVIGRSPAWLLTHFSVPGATCIPLNFYTWMLGATFGWSEMGLRLPSLVCGILCVIVCPLLARDIIGTRQAAWLAFLLAISPILIYYSRSARPYSLVAFLGFVSILCAARWAQAGTWRWGVLYIITGILAIYFHLFAIVTVMTPIVAAVACQIYVRAYTKKENYVAPRLSYWIVAGAIIVVVSGLLMLPALIHEEGGTLSKVIQSTPFRIQSLPRAMTLIAGTAQPIPAAIFWILLVAGVISLCRKSMWLGAMLLSLYPIHIEALAALHPDSVGIPLVMVRYSIPLVPVSLLLVASGLQFIMETAGQRAGFHPKLQALVGFACVTALVLAGPLPQIYSAPNNFTNHGAYQQRYSPIDWSHSFYSDFIPRELGVQTAIRADDVSPFYKNFGATNDSRPLVEYPMMIGDHFNPLYYYQYFHRRPVLVGYETDVNALGSLNSGKVYANNYVDHVLSLIQDPARLRFRNLVSMEDLSTMRARHVGYIVLHKHYESELFRIAPPMPDLPRLYQEYSTKLGPPFYEDTNIVVFKL
jgi:hypothetical protein